MMRSSILPLCLLHLLSVSASPIDLALTKRQSSLESCLSNASLMPITSSSSSYSSDTAAFNQRLQPSPTAVIYPSTPEEISTAILCAASAGASVSARSGGHSYASYGLAGSLVISMDAFTNIEVKDDGTAIIGAGNRLGDVALTLNEQGRAMPHGTCPFVGVGGHASFGGFGLASRLWGLTLDQTIGYDVVLANGTFISNLTPAQDADLFWALTGAGPNYGLITSFYFNTYSVPSTTINFAYSYTYGSVDSSTSAYIFSLFQLFGQNSAPAELGLTFTTGNGNSVTLSGVYYGSMDDYHSAMDGFVGSLPEGYQTTLNELSWIDSLSGMAGGQALNTTGVSDNRDDFLAKSLMTPSNVLITDDVLQSYFDYLFNTQTSTNWFVEVNLYGGANSAIEAKTSSDNSFGGRNKLLNFQMYASSSSYGPPYPDDGVDFVNGMYNTIVDGMSSSWTGDQAPGAYVNYVDPTLTAEEVQSLYWGDQYSRLSSLRGVYDPQSTFNYPQAILASSSS